VHPQGREAEEVAHDARLALAHDAFLVAEIGHGLNLLAAGLGVVVAARDQPRQPLREHDQRVQQDDHDRQRVRRRPGEPPPIAGAERLGDDLGQKQDQQRQHARKDSDRGVAEDHRRLGASTRCAHGMRDRVQAENGRERPVHIVLQPLQARRELGAALFLRGDERWADAEQHGLKDRADEGESDGQNDEQDQQEQWSIPRWLPTTGCP
jgi:hypothetical protein